MDSFSNPSISVISELFRLRTDPTKLHLPAPVLRSTKTASQLTAMALLVVVFQMHTQDSLLSVSRLGLLTVAPISYLVSITARQQVAQIRDAPIYVVTDVALIPLSSQKEASTAIKQVKTSLKKGTAGQGTASSDTDTDGEEHDEDKYTADDGHASPVSTDSPAEDNGSRPVGPQRSSGNMAEDVIGRKGQYGRFAERWFSRAGWSTERRRAQGMSSADAGKLEPGTIESDGDQLTNEDSETEKPATDGVKESHQALNSAEEQFKKDNGSESHGSSTNTYTLLPKLLRTTRILLISRSFFFSYDLDITRRLGTLGPKGSDLPLHKCVDQLVSHTASSPKKFADLNSFYSSSGIAI